MSSTHQARARLEPDEGDAPEERGAAAEQVRRALMQLPRRQAQAAGLVYSEHLTQKQVAVRLRVSPMRVRREMAMALQHLAAILERSEMPAGAPRTDGAAGAAHQLVGVTGERALTALSRPVWLIASIRPRRSR